MSEIEKLDLVLATLYEKPNKRGYLIQLLQGKEVAVPLDEAYWLGAKLGEAGYVLQEPTQVDVALALTTEGIAFIQTSSFAETATPISTASTDAQSPYDTLINEYSQIMATIDQDNVGEARQLLTQIQDVVFEDDTVDEATRRGVIDCALAVEYGIDSGAPFNKYNLQALIELASTVESTRGLALQLAGLSFM